jgi:hypothetical protein
MNTIINFPNRLCYHPIKLLLVLTAYKSWPDALRHLYCTEMGRRETASLRPGSEIWVRLGVRSKFGGNIKQIVVLFIYIQQQITPCVGSYILPVLLL